MECGASIPSLRRERVSERVERGGAKRRGEVNEVPSGRIDFGKRQVEVVWGRIDFGKRQVEMVWAKINLWKRQVDLVWVKINLWKRRVEMVWAKINLWKRQAEMVLFVFLEALQESFEGGGAVFFKAFHVHKHIIEVDL